jgi:hypothetical protein
MQLSRNNRTRSPIVVGGVTLIAVATAACTGNHNKPANGASAGSPSAAATAKSTVPSTSHAASAAADIPTKVPNKPADRKAVTLASCTPSGKGVAAKGTVNRQGKGPADYTITVFFTTSHATVLNFGKTEVHAEPGKPASWTVAKDFSAPKDVRCVLRGVAVK